jgi:hypothetical protein
MDAGVGSFVFSNAVVSKAARLGKDFKITSYGKRVLSAVRGVSPLLVLGFVRLFSTKAADYQVSWKCLKVCGTDRKERSGARERVRSALEFLFHSERCFSSSDSP